MMQETGTVVELQENAIAMVLCRKGSACQHCASVDACHAGHDSGERLVEAHNDINATVGQQVRISISSKTFLRSSFLVYIVPLIALVVCAIIGNAIATSFVADLDPNLISALSGVGGLVVALLVIRQRNQRLNRDDYMPRIVALELSEDVQDETRNHGN
jgi:sigma-E factor negative regulatory protein RseC